MSICYFSKKKFVVKHCGENEIPNFFLENPTFFLENQIFVYRKSEFFIENPIFSRKSESFKKKHTKKTYKIRGVVLVHILLFENIQNPMCGHFPSFPASSFRPRVTYLQYLTQCGVKPGLYPVRHSTQTELRKRIYADTPYIQITSKVISRVGYCGRKIYPMILDNRFHVISMC